MNSFFTSFFSYIRRHALLLAVAVLFILLCVGYGLGYRPGPDFTFVRAGTLTLTGIPKGGTVFADQAKSAVSNGKDVRLVLEPGSHNIIVDVPGDYPWNDVVNVSARMNTKSSPILVPTIVTRTSPDNAGAKTADTLLTTYQLPNAAHPLVMENGCANVYVLDNQVVASVATSTGCTPPPFLCVGGTCATTVVFAPIAPLRAVLAYPGRQDALVVSYGSTLAVIEINPLKPQFFAPLYQGIQPAAASYDATHIVVRDANKTFLIGF